VLNKQIKKLQKHTRTHKSEAGHSHQSVMYEIKSQYPMARHGQQQESSWVYIPETRQAGSWVLRQPLLAYTWLAQFEPGWMHWGCYGVVKCQDCDVVPWNGVPIKAKWRPVSAVCVVVVTYPISLQLCTFIPPSFAHSSFGRPLHDLGGSSTGSPNAPAQVRKRF